MKHQTRQTKNSQLRHNHRLSVVIPTYNGQALLAKHLPDVIKILDPGDEIVVVDDASQDNTLTWLADQQPKLDQQKIQLKLISQKTNQRFAATANNGVASAKHSLVLLLNNDVSPLSLDLKNRLVTWFEQTPNLFAVGCGEVRNNQPDAKLYGRGTGGFRRGLLAHWYDPDQKKYSTLWTAGGSMCLQKSIFLDLGGFDSLFSPAYEEDRDLSYRALKQGYELIFDYEAMVWHQHESTNQIAFASQEVNITSWKNQFLLVWKNITSKQLLCQHFLWLPYHLLVTNWRTKGNLGRGFWRALRQLPAAARQRRRLLPTWKRTDQEVLKHANTFTPSTKK